MAAEPKLGHTRADSGVDGIDSISKTLATAHNFCNAVSSFASENSVQAVTELLKLLPQRENEIKARDDAIRDLKAELAAQEKSHSDYAQKQLSSFEERYDDWSDQNTALQDEIEELEAAAKEKNKELTTLRKALEDNKVKVEDLEKEHTQMTKRLKERNQQVVELEARLQSTKADADGHIEELKKSHDQMAHLKRSFEDEVKRHQSLKEEATKTRERLRELEQFSVEITMLDISGVITQLEALWKSATKLVEKFFGQDLPDNIIKSDWTKLRENDVFKHQISLPQSNTDIAKEMRVAIVLGALARLVDKFIFQPTYLLHEESGLREILRRQAVVDPNKERYTRGILLSMFPEDQEAAGKESIEFVVEELLDNVNVRVLLTQDTLRTFAGELESFVTQSQREWKTIQCGNQKLESSFTYSTSTDRPWHVFDMQIADVENKKNSRAPLATSNVEDNVVILPRIYLFGSGAEPNPITNGCVLRKVHLDAAAEETRKDLKSAPFAQAAPGRHRNRPLRTIPVTGDAGPGGRRGDHFLS